MWKPTQKEIADDDKEKPISSRFVMTETAISLTYRICWTIDLNTQVNFLTNKIVVSFSSLLTLFLVLMRPLLPNFFFNVAWEGNIIIIALISLIAILVVADVRRLQVMFLLFSKVFSCDFLTPVYRIRWRTVFYKT